MGSKLYINGFGISCPLGDHRFGVTQKLISGDTNALQPSGALNSGRSTYIARVQYPLPKLPLSLTDYNCRNTQLLMHSYLQVQETIDEMKSLFGKARIGVVLGSSTAGIAEGERLIDSLSNDHPFPKEYRYLQQELGSVSDFLSKLADVDGPVYTVSTACSSSGKVFASASRLISSGVCDAVIVGGADSLCGLTLNGFDALESLSPDRCQPFSLNRQGINIGEGSALFVVSSEPADIAILGVGESSDGYHISAPEPSGKGAERAIRAALNDAELSPNDIGYLNLHGTATPKNDEMESEVVHRIFGNKIPCSSTKAMIGHTLGAAGAIELAFCCLLLKLTGKQAGLLPPHIWDGIKDPDLKGIHLATPEDSLRAPICMSNNFAFGGSNVSIIVGKVK
ncbi:beta-ketoacyl-[acyl-carrier-protein] synthase family protein [Corallincola luteus]|uniref:Beta-ketoacyl-[acyl-carrier-protein] synthase family protein n=1 Tax=Corallincola luteus TaxID=1775177 RepID=A0ABY2AKE8_9GAMM|nr:beta-ketoacyl-[acyl-carrier-protein] synthase family protein [Corallincola luteus]TCI03293.1 beta-ketoacyl-[acyl-carrier-protein] synthase family protein [Corallincola luteus]